MAKRARGSRRPGQRPPLQRTTARPAVETSTATTASRPPSLTDQEEARAAELEAQILVEERAADESRRRSTERRRGGSAPVEVAPRGTLSMTAAEEYAYVGRDVRRITLIGGSLIILLVVLSLISHLSGVGPI
jgi:hypothetical protein